MPGFLVRFRCNLNVNEREYGTSFFAKREQKCKRFPERDQ